MRWNGLLNIFHQVRKGGTNKKNKRDQKKTNSKVVYLNPNVSIVVFDVNRFYQSKEGHFIPEVSVH